MRSFSADVLPLEPQDPPLAGDYRLRGRLGFGGMGVVYLADGPDGPVAVKTMRRADLADAGARARFRAEAACARRAASAHTVRVLEDASHRPDPYLVTEYVAGPSLGEVVRRDGPLPPEALHAVALGVADALAGIHEAGVVHRDVKPGNVLLSPAGPRVIDFGIARDLDDPGAMTRTGVVMGSPGWIAPERIAGGSACAASDVFCWGMLVAYAGTGRHPFGAGDGFGERVLALAPDLDGLDGRLRPLVEAALSKDRLRRPTARELCRRLLAPCREETAEQAVAELWPVVRHRLRAFGRRGLPARPRRRPWAPLLAALVLPVAAGAFFFTDPAGSEPGGPSSPAVRVVVSTVPAPTVTVTSPPPKSRRPPPADELRPKKSEKGKPGKHSKHGKGRKKGKNR